MYRMQPFTLFEIDKTERRGEERRGDERRGEERRREREDVTPKK